MSCNVPVKLFIEKKPYFFGNDDPAVSQDLNALEECPALAEMASRFDGFDPMKGEDNLEDLLAHYAPADEASADAVLEAANFCQKHVEGALLHNPECDFNTNVRGGINAYVQDCLARNASEIMFNRMAEGVNLASADENAAFMELCGGPEKATDVLWRVAGESSLGNFPAGRFQAFDYAQERASVMVETGRRNGEQQESVSADIAKLIELKEKSKQMLRGGKMSLNDYEELEKRFNSYLKDAAKEAEQIMTMSDEQLKSCSYSSLSEMHAYMSAWKGWNIPNMTKPADAAARIKTVLDSYEKAFN